MDTPNALLDVVWTDWVADAEKAMHEVLEETEKVSVIGHSMGGWLGIILATEHAKKIDSIIIAGGSTKGTSPFGSGGPLHFLFPVLPLLKKTFTMTPADTDTKYIRSDTGYAWVPTKTWNQVFGLMKETHKRLPMVTVPTLILHSKKDTMNSPAGAQILYDSIATPADQKRLVWFEKTGHVMFLDCEEEQVNQAVVEFLQERITQN